MATHSHEITLFFIVTFVSSVVKGRCDNIFPFMISSLFVCRFVSTIVVVEHILDPLD